MRLLLWHCERLEYSDKSPSTRPIGIGQQLGPKMTGVFDNTIAAFTCVEVDDDDQVVVQAGDSIVALAHQLKNSTVVIVPFAHLSKRLAPPDVATSLLEDLETTLRNQKLRVQRTSFGYHKDFALSFRSCGHPGSVAFRSFRSDKG